MRLAVALATGNPFTNLQSNAYWSSSSTCINVAGVVDMDNGQYTDQPVSSLFNVWPVRR
jgi:hypothetical protein